MQAQKISTLGLYISLYNHLSNFGNQQIMFTRSVKNAAGTLRSAATARTLFGGAINTSVRFASRDSKPRYNNNDRGHRNNDGYKGPRRQNNFRKGSFGKRQSSQVVDYDQTDLFVSKKSKGDGLMGEPSYHVDYEKLVGFDLDTLKDETGEPAEGFSNIPTLKLAENQILDRRLVNSMFYGREYKQLTTVQSKSLIPILTQGSMIVRAKTGTGKTAAFGIPMIQKVWEKVKTRKFGDPKKVLGLVVTPTRDLAEQVAVELQKLTQFGDLTKIKVGCLVGGINFSRQAERSFGRGKPEDVSDIIVATPGRLYDYLTNESYDHYFSGVTIKVLDECDLLLDIGFKQSLDDIRSRLEELGADKVQTLLFSATTKPNIVSLARNEVGSKPLVINTVPEDDTPIRDLVNQRAVVCDSFADVYVSSLDLIIKDVKTAEDAKNYKAIVFLPTINLVKHFTRMLKDTFVNERIKGIEVYDVHGQQSQPTRSRYSSQFRKAQSAIMVCTDVAARGMDFPHVSHVVQIMSPGNTETYIHRIGRTARIGRRGDSLLVLTNFERNFLRDLQNENISMEAQKWEANEQFEEQIQPRIEGLFTEDENREILESLYILLSKYSGSIDKQKFHQAQLETAQYFGLESVRVPNVVRKSWTQRQSKGYGYGGYGGSRGVPKNRSFRYNNRSYDRSRPERSFHDEVPERYRPRRDRY